MLEVRQASADDLAAVRQLLHDTWHATDDATMGIEVVNDITSRWHSVENLNRQLGDPSGYFPVAENPDGTIGGHANAVRKSADLVSLARLYVLPQLQGGGAGTALLTAVTDWAGQGTTTELEVETLNASAIGFYRKHCFADDDQQVQCGGDPAAGQAIVMRRRNIVAGDFNATPHSVMLELFQSGTGLKRVTMLPTWPAIGPSLPDLPLITYS